MDIANYLEEYISIPFLHTRMWLIKVQVNEDRSPGISMTVIFTTTPFNTPIQSWHKPDPHLESIVLRGSSHVCATKPVHRGDWFFKQTH
jgi:hypothetical protein